MDKPAGSGAPRPRSARNPPQLLRQAGQEECPPVCHLRATITQDSQTSSSNSSGGGGPATGSRSVRTNATGASWSSSVSSSGDSRSQRMTSSSAAPAVGGSSSATSSTEETEARERRFGSLDLHPLPSHVVVVPTIRSAVRGFCPRLATAALIPPAPGDLGRHSQPSVHLVTATSCLAAESNSAVAGGGNGGVGSSSWKTLTGGEESPATVVVTAPNSCDDQNPAAIVLTSDAPPPALWPRLLCPVHSEAFISWFKGRLLPTDDCQQASPATEDAMPISGVQSLSHYRMRNRTSASSSSSSFAPPHLWPAVEQGAIPQRIGPYVLGHTLGRGNFAVVKLAMHTVTKMLVAVKIMNKHLIGRTSLNKLSRELEAMKRCIHPHIVRLYHVMETKTNIFMITEYASKGEVFDHVSMSRAFSEKEARELFWQLACAIAFCHQSGVVHRDLKAENLLLDDDFNIKVADFGFCNFFQPNELLSTHCGSPQYAAPELFLGEPYDGPLADVWSLGVILYILVCGSFPFPGESLGDIRIQVLRGLVRFPFFLSTSCEQVIRCMLQVDPAKRFKLQEVIKTPWMQASPKVQHYSQLLAKYESRAKQYAFDEIFKRQYPKHSQVVQSDHRRRAERALDTGVLGALAQCSGLDEQQVRQSTLLNACDHPHACYQLLVAKIRRFRRSEPLRQVVNEAVGLAVGPEQKEKEGSSAEKGISGVLTTTNHPLGEWADPDKPESTVLKVAQFILKADEENILSSRGLTSALVNRPPRSTLNESVRRHTVQLTSPMLTTLTSAESAGYETSTTEGGPTMADVDADSLTQVESSCSGLGTQTGVDQPSRSRKRDEAIPRLPYRFPRQTTQPQITGGAWWAAAACGQPRTRQSNQLRVG